MNDARRMGIEYFDKGRFTAGELVKTVKDMLE